MRFRAGGGSVDAVEGGVPDRALTDAGPLPMCRKDL